MVWFGDWWVQWSHSHALIQVEETLCFGVDGGGCGEWTGAGLARTHWKLGNVDAQHGVTMVWYGSMVSAEWSVNWTRLRRYFEVHAIIVVWSRCIFMSVNKVIVRMKWFCCSWWLLVNLLVVIFHAKIGCAITHGGVAEHCTTGVNHPQNECP